MAPDPTIWMEPPAEGKGQKEKGSGADLGAGQGLRSARARSRPPRAAEGGLIDQARNRAVARATIFADDDYDAFLRALAEACSRHAVRRLAYCVMPNHFRLVLWPRGDGDRSRFMRWLTMTHTQRGHVQRRSAGTGHLDQGRFRSFPVQGDGHFHSLGRYVERNALRAGLVSRAEDWRWGSLAGQFAPAPAPGPALDPWPSDRPTDWVERVNVPLGPPEEEAMRRAIRRGQPFGDPEWQGPNAARLGLVAAHE